MDQKKIGLFLRELRKEKGLTQEQLSEYLNVASRTVSRWETGANLPDISLLVELADFYGVDIKEIIDGERKSEIMNENTRETLEKVAEYSKKTNNKIMTKVIILMSSIFVVLLALIIILFTSTSSSIEDTDMYPVYKQVYLDKEVTEELLRDYVLGEMAESAIDSEFKNAADFTDFAIFSSEEKSSGNYYVYTWVLELTYSFDAGVLSRESGASYPCRFELIRENDTFKIVDVNVPRDGSYYAEDINKLFPEYVRERINSVYSDGTLSELDDNILNEAKDYFNIR